MTLPTSQAATERVGRYQLLEPIGVGPCGAVSRAKVFGVAGFERQFAIKRFSAEVTGSAALAQSLSAAARGYGSLEHPRIARMSEFGVAQGTTFTAVEYVAGLDALRLVAEARLAGAGLAAGGALALVSQAARAVGYAHGRGLTHLGLSPTNVLVTAEGDIKITDFGILAATLPQRPIDVARLANRIAYLAPEQLANEATSAATDVFALGVLAYELVTGQRAFRGETPQQIAQSVMAGPPGEPALPRPIVRVLQRCLARSPFERFPDARALADALDAALRVAPVPGTRKDIGAQVKATLDRLAALHESELSGMVALNVQTASVPRAPTSGPVPVLGMKERDPATTLQDMPKLPTTVAGLAPPPIGVPPGVTPSQPIPVPTGAQTLTPASTFVGLAPSRSGAPPIPRPRVSDAAPSAAPVPSLAKPGAFLGVDTKPGVTPPVKIPEGRSFEGMPSAPDISVDPDELDFGETVLRHDDIDGETIMQRDADDDGEPDAEPDAEPRRDTPTGEMSPLVAQRLATAATKPTRELDRHVTNALDTSRPADPDPDADDLDMATVLAPDAPLPDAGPPPAVPELPRLPARVTPVPAAMSGLETRTDAPVRTEPGFVPPRAAPTPVRPAVVHIERPKTMPPPSSGKGAKIIVGTLLLAGLAVGGAFAYKKLAATPDEPAGSAAVVATPSDAAPSTPPLAAPDAAVAVATGVDAGAPTPPADAAAQVAATEVDAGTSAAATTGDTLVVTSTPPGARVFLDGADSGVTPLKLPGTTDRHSMVLFLPSHELYVAQVDGRGTFAIPMKPVTPMDGPAGIKVTRCKDKDRYYVTVDGKPSGQTCPTERIQTELGPHTVDIYDLHTEKHTEYKIDVTDTRLSYRVKIDP